MRLARCVLRFIRAVTYLQTAPTDIIAEPKAAPAPMAAPTTAVELDSIRIPRVLVDTKSLDMAGSWINADGTVGFTNITTTVLVVLSSESQTADVISWTVLPGGGFEVTVKESYFGPCSAVACVLFPACVCCDFMKDGCRCSRGCAGMDQRHVVYCRTADKATALAKVHADHANLIWGPVVLSDPARKDWYIVKSVAVA